MILEFLILRSDTRLRLNSMLFNPTNRIMLLLMNALNSDNDQYGSYSCIRLKTPVVSLQCGFRKRLK